MSGPRRVRTGRVPQGEGFPSPCEAERTSAFGAVLAGSRLAASGQLQKPAFPGHGATPRAVSAPQATSQLVPLETGCRTVGRGLQMGVWLGFRCFGG